MTLPDPCSITWSLGWWPRSSILHSGHQASSLTPPEPQLPSGPASNPDTFHITVPLCHLAPPVEMTPTSYPRFPLLVLLSPCSCSIFKKTRLVVCLLPLAALSECTPPMPCSSEHSLRRGVPSGERCTQAPHPGICRPLVVAGCGLVTWQSGDQAPDC
jgi:hypothetical protein